MSNKIFITGGGGFLGKHVLHELQGENILAPRSTELNILSFKDLKEYLDKHKPDCILHMAAVCGGILANKNSPADFLTKNTQMGLNIYEAARLCNIKQVYSLGTVCAYPKFCPVPFKEEDIWNGYPEETNAPYSQGKRTLLMLSQTYRQQYGIKGAFLIPVNMYGTYDNFDLTNSHVVPALIRKFVNAVDHNLPEVECWGTGGATREFLAAQDCAQVLVKAVLSGFDHDQPINLGTGKDISIKDLASLIGHLTGFTGKIIFNGTVSDGQPKRLLDVSKAKKLLNWQATTSLTDGLRQTIDWYRSNKHLIK